jgi:hypothetical protein
VSRKSPHICRFLNDFVGGLARSIFGATANIDDAAAIAGKFR